MSDDLVEWLRAQLDDDERVARAVEDEHWREDVAEDFHMNEFDPAVREHLLRHDPARVLREVEAKRRILDLHVHEPATGEPGFGCRVCDWQGMWEGVGPGGWCPTLRLLAAVYADRPGYRSEWAP